MIIKTRDGLLRLMPKQLVALALGPILLSLGLPFSSHAVQRPQLRLESELQLRSDTAFGTASRRFGSGSTITQNPNFAGSFEIADCNSISGWIQDPNNLNTAVRVNIFAGSTLVATAIANSLRNDVGRHGFSIPTPAALNDTDVHTLSARGDASSNDILNSPRQMGPCLTPRDNVGTEVILALDFNLNNGAASTQTRLVSPIFTARERTGGKSRDVTADVTHYRTRESPDSKPADLSAQPWIPLTHALIHELALRNGLGRRYGERRVMFQVKTAALTSDVVSDTILLEPAVKEYRVNGTTLIQYAASQGFTFPLEYYETCKGQCPGGTADLSLASGTANVTVQGISTSGDNTVACVATIVAAVVTVGVAAPLAVLVCNSRSAPVAAGTCTTKADYLLFEGRSPNQFWRIKSVDVPRASVHTHGANSFRAKSIFVNKDGSCGPGVLIEAGDVVVEGPEVDDFVDPANPWKNAFVRTPVSIGPGIRERN